MGAASSPDPTTAPFEFGMPRLILQLESLLGSLLTRSSLLHAPLTGGTSFLGLMTTLPLYCKYFHIFLSDLSLVTQSILVLVQSPTRMGGSRTQRVAYYTGYPTTVVKPYIHLPSRRSPLHLLIDLSLLALTTLLLEHHGVKFSKVCLPRDWYRGT